MLTRRSFLVLALAALVMVLVMSSLPVSAADVNACTAEGCLMCTELDGNLCDTCDEENGWKLNSADQKCYGGSDAAAQQAPLLLGLAIAAVATIASVY